MDKTRCHWFDKSNDILRKYHDEEFGILNSDDDYLFEILVLVNFQTGLSWEIMLRKREDFREGTGKRGVCSTFYGMFKTIEE